MPARLARDGNDVVTVLAPAWPMFGADGPQGPTPLPIPTLPADSPRHALEM